MWIIMKMLKKIGNAIAGLFRAIFKWIDRRIIVPLTKFILMITEKTGKKTGKLEKWLTKKNTLIFLSLLIALFAFFVVDSKSIVLVDSSAEVLYDQKVNVIYNEEAYVVEGLPETADVTLIGRKVDLYLAKQLSTGSINVDISNLKEGQHKVNLNYESPINSVNYKLDPSSVTIYIYPKVSENRTVEVDVINKDKLDSKLSIQDVKVDQDQIIIKGAEHTLKEVATVKALVDVNNIVDPQVGVTTLEDVKLVAYDSDGKVVDVEMVPNKVKATISIVSPSKEVPVKVIPKGNVIFGKAISSISADVTNVTVYGDENVINDLQFIPIEVDVTNLDSDKEYNVIINKPSGVTEISVTSAVVTVTLGDEVTKEIEDVYIETTNLDSNYKAAAIGENSSKTSVIIKGTQEVLDSIDVDTIKATVDLSGYSEGDYEVEVVVTGDDVRASFTPKTTKIKVRISKK